jgi:hypothetical protein
MWCAGNVINRRCDAASNMRGEYLRKRCVVITWQRQSRHFPCACRDNAMQLAVNERPMRRRLAPFMRLRKAREQQSDQTCPKSH